MASFATTPNSNTEGPDIGAPNCGTRGSVTVFGDGGTCDRFCDTDGELMAALIQRNRWDVQTYVLLAGGLSPPSF